MVKISVKGKEYILRFDMSVMDELEEKGKNIAQMMTGMKSNKEAMPVIEEIFTALANAGADYLGKDEVYTAEEIRLFGKHDSFGWLKTVKAAIEQAVKDGSRMQANDVEDKKTHDVYLEQIEKEEALKN